MKQRVKDAMIAAWKAKEIEKRDFLKFCIGEIERKEDAVTKLDDEAVEDELISIAKNLRIVGDAESRAQLGFLSAFLPEPMTMGEVREALVEIITDGGYSGIRDMGKVMDKFNTEYKGRAPGSAVSSLAREII